MAAIDIGTWCVGENTDFHLAEEELLSDETRSPTGSRYSQTFRRHVDLFTDSMSPSQTVNSVIQGMAGLDRLVRRCIRKIPTDPDPLDLELGNPSDLISLILALRNRTGGASLDGMTRKDDDSSIDGAFASTGHSKSREEGAVNSLTASGQDGCETGEKAPKYNETEDTVGIKLKSQMASDNASSLIDHGFSTESHQHQATPCFEEKVPFRGGFTAYQQGHPFLRDFMKIWSDHGQDSHAAQKPAGFSNLASNDSFGKFHLGVGIGGQTNRNDYFNSLLKCDPIYSLFSRASDSAEFQDVSCCNESEEKHDPCHRLTPDSTAFGDSSDPVTDVFPFSDPFSELKTALPSFSEIFERKDQGDSHLSSDNETIQLTKESDDTALGDDSNEDIANQSPKIATNETINRITYNTTPYAATSADTPSFNVSTPRARRAVFSATKAKMIPLDFNLNAVYKTGNNDVTAQHGSGNCSQVHGANSHPDQQQYTVTHRLVNSERQGNLRVREHKDGAIETKFVVKTLSSHCSLQSPVGQCLFTGTCTVALTSFFLVGFSAIPALKVVWDTVLHTALVILLMVIIVIALETNDLTEVILQRGQHLSRGLRDLVQVKNTNVPMANDAASSQTVQQSSEKLEIAEQGHISKPDLSITAMPPTHSDAAELFHKPVLLTKFERIAETREELPSAEKTQPIPETGSPDKKEPRHSEPNIVCLDASSLSLDDNTVNSADIDIIGSNVYTVSPDVRPFRSDLEITSSDINTVSSEDRAVVSHVKTMNSDVKTVGSESNTKRSPEVKPDETERIKIKTCSQLAQTENIQFLSSFTQTENATIVMSDGSEDMQVLGLGSRTYVDASVQANADAHKVYLMTEKIQQRHMQNVRKLQKRFLAIRRRCQQEAKTMKISDRRKTELLTKLQLSIPGLQKEKTALLAERASLERQFEEEKMKNRELVGRLTKLNQQFYRLGKSQQPPTSTQWRQCSQTMSNSTLSLGRQLGETASQSKTVSAFDRPCPTRQTQPISQQYLSSAPSTKPQGLTTEPTSGIASSSRLSYLSTESGCSKPQQSIPTPTQLQQRSATQQTSQPYDFSHLQQQLQQQQQFPTSQQQQQRLPIFQLFNKTFSHAQSDTPSQFQSSLLRSRLQQQQTQQQQQQQQVSSASQYLFPHTHGSTGPVYAQHQPMTSMGLSAAMTISANTASQVRSVPTSL